MNITTIGGLGRLAATGAAAAAFAGAAHAGMTESSKVRWFVEPRASLDGAQPWGPMAEGVAFVFAPDGTRAPLPPAQAGLGAPPLALRGLQDLYLGDGEGGVAAGSHWHPFAAVFGCTEGWLGIPSVFSTTDGMSVGYSGVAVSPGAPYTGHSLQPWAQAGYANGEFYQSRLWLDTTAGSFRTRASIARTTNYGQNWSTFYATYNRTASLDGTSFDIDRMTSSGGGPGATYDWRAYLTYDDFGSNGSGYVGSYLQVVNPAGTFLSELTLSTPAQFRGSRFHVETADADGRAYVQGLAQSGNGATTVHILGRIDLGGTLYDPDWAAFQYPSAGQRLGSSQHFGVNGHRLTPGGDYEASLGTFHLRDRLWLFTGRNPNPTTPTADQGDIYVSIADYLKGNVTSGMLPHQAPGKTQYLPTSARDRRGNLFVMYYQNDAGPNNGVLNATVANLYYQWTRDGGMSWAPPRRVNDAEHALDHASPPPDRASTAYYVLGDTQGLSVAGFGRNKRVHAAWTQYDKDRGGAFVGDKRTRVYWTVIDPCEADYNMSGLVELLDIFDFLEDWFNFIWYSDYNDDGVLDIFDIFDFLEDWFPGCPQLL